MAESTPPKGWHADEDTGAWVRDVIPHMGRRCFAWDYRGKGTYLVTMTLADRKSAALGRLASEGPHVELSALGRGVEALIGELPRHWPGVGVLGEQVMPDHVHLVLEVRQRQKKPLGAIVGSLKSKTSALAAQLGRTRPSATEAGEGKAMEAGEAAWGSCATARAPSLWAPGYVDNILFDARAAANALAYVADNPRRLWEKKAHPELFAVLRDLPVDLGGFTGHFAAIGNHALLAAPQRMQVQCSRRYFAYARDRAGKLLKDNRPRIETAEFRATCSAALEAATAGAVLVSPCISEGEREISRRAFAAGHRLIMLANKGFSPLYKPGGQLFDTCLGGRLLMLAPLHWPYQPGEKRMTREDACVLNRLAQCIAGEGAVEIVYHGHEPEELDALVRQTV